MVIAKIQTVADQAKEALKPAHHNIGRAVKDVNNAVWSEICETHGKQFTDDAMRISQSIVQLVPKHFNTEQEKAEVGMQLIRNWAKTQLHALADFECVLFYTLAYASYYAEQDRLALGDALAAKAETATVQNISTLITS